MRSIRVLIVDDHALFAEALAARLGAEPDLEVLPVAGDVRRTAALVATEAPDVVVLDFVLGEESGLDALDLLGRRHPEVRVVVLSGITDISPMVTALRRGAVAWVPKTESADLVARVIRGAAGRGGWIPPDVLGDVLRRLLASGEGDGGVLTGLTPREREVLQGMVDGLNRARLAERLGLSANTVRTHTQNLLAKLGAHSAVEAITIAMRAGVTPTDPREGPAS
ncbi:response regulator transcription factor [Actinoallomurus purpureus]|uniref:LuxR C-terminal-related transcriptional regulator n=1 Tax=Actinoallomurus purpureus TaxID=478114 RepID=UPI002092AE2C|nr:response regulator transcription factor [Actinoallomurus purpureus]MCO6006078.1 response regulator transcription factor [Actinoallomurus purpureus]